MSMIYYSGHRSWCLSCLIILLLITTTTTFVSASFDPSDAAKGFADRVVPGQYICLLDELQWKQVQSQSAVEVVASNLARQFGVTLAYTFPTIVLTGFSIRDAHDDKAVDQLRQHVLVTDCVADGYVRQLDFNDNNNDNDYYNYINQTDNLPWGLDRMDGGHTDGLDGSYTYLAGNAGQDTHVYIVDTGIHLAHTEFAGRIAPDEQHFNTIDAAPYQDPPYNDCHGHGTHVASTVAGSYYGVAKQATIHAVRVLDCGGSGSWSSVIQGMGLVALDCEEHGYRHGGCIVNLSLGGGLSDIVNRAVDALVDSGATVVVAAGNDDTDACQYSPASARQAVTVGSTTPTDERSAFSNYGACVDLFAPGSDILGAWYGCTDCTRTLSGTSMASPHVAGVAALIVQNFAHHGVPTTRDAVLTQLHADAVYGVIDLDLSDNDLEDTINALLQRNTPFVSHPPSLTPTVTPPPTDVASARPSNGPTQSDRPSSRPSTEPSLVPSVMPSPVTCADDEYKIEIILETDDNAWQTSFTLVNTCVDTDEDNELIDSIEIYTLADYTRYSYIHCVGFGRYEFTIFDYYSNGILYPGYYEVVYENARIAKNFYFAASETVVFGDDDCITPAPTLSQPPSTQPTQSAQPTTTPGPTVAPSTVPTAVPSAQPTGFQCGENQIYLLVEILTDAYGHEIYWDLTNDCTATVIESVSTFSLDDRLTYQWQLCLDEHHQHTFAIGDTYGDGIFPPGYVRLYLDGNLILDDPGYNYAYSFSFLQNDEDDCTGSASSMPSAAPTELLDTLVCDNNDEDAAIPLLVQVHTDADAHETGLVVENVCTAAVVLEMDAMDDLKYYQFPLCVSAQEHRLTLQDSFGDGLFAPGYVKVHYNGDVILDRPVFQQSYTMTFGSSCPAAKPTPACPCHQRRRSRRFLCKMRNPVACFL